MTQERINKYFETDLGQQLSMLFSTSDDRVFIRYDEAVKHTEGKLDPDTQPLEDKTIQRWFEFDSEEVVPPVELPVNKTYRFGFWNGTGIGEIWSETIKIFPIDVLAKNDEEAIARVNKKRIKLAKYNNCYSDNSTLPVECEGNIGLFWPNYNVIRWPGEEIFWGLTVVPQHTINSYILKPHEYFYDTRWIANYAGKTTYPSIDHVLNWIKLQYPKHYDKQMEYVKAQLQKKPKVLQLEEAITIA